MSMTSPRLSIITIVRNDPCGLTRTLVSVARLKGSSTEYLLIDGASTDATLQVLNKFPGIVDRMISEPDHGIYDAMNKGMRMASGDYILFLNAGDELLVNPEELLSTAGVGTVLVYAKANMLYPDGSLRYVKGKRLRSVRRFLKGMPLCHQSALYLRETIIPFDLRFRVMADRVMTYLLLRQHGLKKSVFVNMVMVNYYEGGFSSSLPSQLLREEENHFFRQVGKPHYIFIKTVNALFKSKIKQPVKRFFCGGQA